MEAVWAPILSNIRFKTHNNSNFATLTNIIKGSKLDLTNVPEPSLKGNTFKGWFDDSGKEYKNGSIWDKGTTSREVPTYILEAQWDIIDYDITYDLQGGTITGEPSSFNVMNNIDLTDSKQMPVPQKFGFIFNGWKVNGKTITTTAGQYDKIKLTAQWLGIDKFSTSYANNSKITDSIIVLDFSKEPTNVNKVLKIANSVTQITLKGDGGAVRQNLRFIIESRTTAITTRQAVSSGCISSLR